MARIKFKVDSITHEDDGALGQVASTKLSAVVGEDKDSENSKFFKYTPKGKLSLGAIHPESIADLVPGLQYYIDIIPVEVEG